MSQPGPGAGLPGYRATVAALAAGQLLCWAALYYGFASFVLPMLRDLNWGKPTLMGAFTLGLGVWSAAAYAVGAAIDRGRGRWVMSGGAALAGVGFLAWSQVSQPWMLYAVWVVLGAAMAMTLYEPAFNILTKRYPERYREGITTLTLVGGFASTLSFPALAALLALVGWRSACVIIGLVLLLVAVPLHAWALQGPELAARPPGGPRRDDASLHRALRSAAFWLLTLAFTLYSFASGVLWAHVMPAFADKGLTEDQAVQVLVWFGPAQVVGRLLYAWLGRGWSLHAMGTVVLACMSIALALFALSRSMAPLLLFALLFGVANGLTTIVRGGIVPQYFGRSNVGRIGGTMSAIGLLARAAAPLLAAWLLLSLAGYRELMLMLAALSLLAVVAFWLARPPA